MLARRWAELELGAPRGVSLGRFADPVRLAGLGRRSSLDELGGNGQNAPVITEVLLRNFKRFGELRFELPGHVVLAGPNNTGKTTLLQAIATWALALDR